MPDLPDWYKYLGDSSRYPMGDMGELAARLGSPSIYERLGEVVWYDDFGKGTGPYWTTLSGTGASIKPRADNVYQSPFGLRLTGGSDASKSAQITRYFAPLDVGKWGFEVAVTFPTNFDVFKIGCYYFSADTTYFMILRFDQTNSIVTLNVQGTDPTIYDMPQMWGSNGYYHNIKIVADFSTGYYVRLLVNNESYNISEYPIGESAIVSPPMQTFWMSINSRTGQNDYCQLDRTIITANEP